MGIDYKIGTKNPLTDDWKSLWKKEIEFFFLFPEKFVFKFVLLLQWKSVSILDKSI